MSYRGKEKAGSEIPLYHTAPGSDNRVGRFVFKPRASWKQLLSLQDAKVIGLIMGSWVILVHLVERTHVRYVINKCQWKNWENWDKKTGIVPHRVALVADPQLVDDNSYPDRPDLLNYFVKKICDNYLRRNHRFLQRLLDPDSTIFLGDLFDGGRDWNDQLWFEEYERFTNIFPAQPHRITIKSLPGNHDIGFQTIDPLRQKRFERFFGPPNDVVTLGNHTVVLLDVISLSSESKDINRPPHEFLQSLPATMEKNIPKILLTHVPLYRDNQQQTCGPKRESPNPFPVKKGKQYQTVVEHDLTSEILDTINPCLVFGGDDHDYCEISHQLSHGLSAKEITVKSVAMSAGIKHPALQLLSLHNPVDAEGQSLAALPTYSTEMCYLPSPLAGITLYVIWFSISIIVLGLKTK
ncbi:Metallo-dependent phosphatase [Yamadazyma tenuis ATCC 10573]|uniref:Metallo-dependent phosphatase n=1 Tax=Candida tenuis (strain ATCC 10573 / BCRC 21748 / CBS 615 / JCM 9827 / NBRC 10315 / NRRL Y-1498 / VKM Y-70) TaxID=590646 RepID=G3AX75_CANTC|nr:Metallo-dependent phosphatase [Yamadazyma tenuis ATCC 10573]EGV66709.1 Metallo-dependent phosphatase [Yamadazyma tenuis ATCC 10573]